jgi:hypothetical protein
VQRAVGTPLSEVDSAGDARYMHGADGRNRYNDEGRASGKGVVYISSERVGAWLIEAGVVGASVTAAREVLSLASRCRTPPSTEDSERGEEREAAGARA